MPKVSPKKSSETKHPKPEPEESKNGDVKQRAAEDYGAKSIQVL